MTKILSKLACKSGMTMKLTAKLVNLSSCLWFLCSCITWTAIEKGILCNLKSRVFIYTVDEQMYNVTVNVLFHTPTSRLSSSYMEVCTFSWSSPCCVQHPLSWSESYSCNTQLTHLPQLMVWTRQIPHISGVTLVKECIVIVQGEHDQLMRTSHCKWQKWY